MDSTIAESPAPHYKDRGSWLVAFGVIEILLGALVLLVILFTLMALVIPLPPHTTGSPAVVQTVGMVIGVGVYIMIAAFFFFAGIGSILRRNWARILMLSGSVVWLFIGALATFFSLFLFPRIMAMQKPSIPAAQHIEHIVVSSMVLMAIVFGILLPLVFLIFYSRKSVKATCLAREDAPASADTPLRELPVPLIILVMWEALAAVSVWAFFFSPVRVTSIFGYTVRGWPVIAIMLVFSALSAAAALLIYGKRLAGWNIALWKLLFFGASAGVSLATGSMSRLFVEMYQTPGQEKFAQLLSQFITVVMVGSLVICAAYLALLIYSRRFFLPATPSAVS